MVITTPETVRSNLRRLYAASWAAGAVNDIWLETAAGSPSVSQAPCDDVHSRVVQLMLYMSNYPVTACGVRRELSVQPTSYTVLSLEQPTARMAEAEPTVQALLVA